MPSSREDVDRDSSWNQWLRNEIHTLFIEALEVFKVKLCTCRYGTVFKKDYVCLFNEPFYTCNK